MFGAWFVWRLRGGRDQGWYEADWMGECMDDGQYERARGYNRKALILQFVFHSLYAFLKKSSFVIGGYFHILYFKIDKIYF